MLDTKDCKNKLADLLEFGSTYQLSHLIMAFDYDGYVVMTLNLLQNHSTSTIPIPISNDILIRTQLVEDTDNIEQILY